MVSEGFIQSDAASYVGSEHVQAGGSELPPVDSLRSVSFTHVLHCWKLLLQ